MISRWLALVFIGACSPDLPNGTFACDVDSGCPTNMTCWATDNRCHTTAFDPGACGAPGDLANYWPFDEGDGGLAHDCVGGFDGVGVYAVGWSTDSHHGGSAFVGAQAPDANAPYFQMGTTLAEGPPFTITAWVKPSGNPAVIASYGTGGYAHSNGWELIVSDQPMFVVGIGTGGQASAGAPPISPNTWAFVAAAFDGSTLRVCKDKVCIEKSLDGGTFSPFTNHEFRVGSDYDFGARSTLVDDLRLYKRALSESEILVVQGL